MSLARENFVGRLEALRSILASPLATDSTPVPTPTSAAVTVRNGCMVMLFCALEAFIRDRSLECAQLIDQVVVPYTHLPTGLKYASLVSTFEALLTSTRGMQDADRMQEFEIVAAAASAGHLGAPYQFTRYSFGRERSNIGKDDLIAISKSFGVANLWNAMQAVAGKVGSALPGGVDEEFRQLARERHKAAHLADHNVPHSQITAALPKAVSIALSFDALISQAAYKLNRSSLTSGGAVPRITDADIEFVAVRPTAAGWRGFRPHQARAAFVESSEVAALARATTIARPRAHCVVCYDLAGRPATWRTPIG